jgi:hypothetical protein
MRELYKQLLYIDEQIYELKQRIYAEKVAYDRQWTGKPLTTANKLAAQPGWRKWLMFTISPLVKQITELTLEHNRISAEIEGIKKAS